MHSLARISPPHSWWYLRLLLRSRLSSCCSCCDFGSIALRTILSASTLIHCPFRNPSTESVVPNTPNSTQTSQSCPKNSTGEEGKWLSYARATGGTMRSPLQTESTKRSMLRSAASSGRWRPIFALRAGSHRDLTTREVLEFTLSHLKCDHRAISSLAAPGRPGERRRAGRDMLIGLLLVRRRKHRRRHLRMSRIVITGAPGAGKTTLLLE